MALSDLKSAYSFYTARGQEPGFKPNSSVNQTDFEYNADLTVSARPKGFDHNTSQAVSFETKTSLDKFIISNTQGDSSRLNQLGQGSIFPIGPSGDVHKFDIKRLGFNINNKYQDTFSSLSDAGLANTYTENSPIDDVYNIVKVRDVASRRGYARQPFILRGIQRDDNSDPQRFGPTINLNLPRAGIITNANRMALDVARISKFLISPEGLLFNIRQFGQQLMNPNVEGTSGRVGKLLNPNSTKLYTPINLLANVAGAPYGLRSRRHGLLPFDIGIQPSNYEETVITGRRTERAKIKNNRLVGLRKDLLESKFVEGAGGLLGTIQSISQRLAGYKGEVIQRLSGLTGPGSVGGIGATTIRRYTSTPSLSNLDSQIEIRRRSPLKFRPNIEDEVGDLKDSEPLFYEIGSGETLAKSKVGDVNAYKTLSYGDIKRIASGRTSTSTEIIDPTTGKTYDILKSPLGKKGYAKDTDLLVRDVHNENNLSTTDTYKDFVKLQFKRGSKVIRFACLITSLDDQLGKPQNRVEEQDGRGESNFDDTNQSVTRVINLSFFVAAHNPSELATIYYNLDSLRKAVVANSNSRTHSFKLGNIFNINQVMILDVNTTWDTEYAFELTEKVPFILEISVTIEANKPRTEYGLGYKGRALTSPIGV